MTLMTLRGCRAALLCIACRRVNPCTFDRVRCHSVFILSGYKLIEACQRRKSWPRGALRRSRPGLGLVCAVPRARLDARERVDAHLQRHQRAAAVQRAVPKAAQNAVVVVDGRRVVRPVLLRADA
jgi:hypothetical protein